MAHVDYSSRWIPTVVPLTGAPYRILQALYQEHHAHLVRYAGKLVRGDEPLAEDIVQVVFECMFNGAVPVPAVDVRRKLEEKVRHSCTSHLQLVAAERARIAARKSRDACEEAGWHVWRKALKWRSDRNDDLGEDQ